MSSEKIIEKVCCLPIDFRQSRSKSVNDLARMIGHRRFAKFVNVSVAEKFFVERPDIVDEWLTWSQDKRNAPAWYFIEDGDEFIVGYYPDGERYRFSDRAKACAKFAILEFEDIFSKLAD
ncbi:MAG: hypothetical protein ACU0DI_12835 [Paracoccaceae bacterium]